ncbi:embryo defective 1273 [Euphorbia peplus]|nr:embryo defective 1273 [Euphorbia peplus]
MASYSLSSSSRLHTSTQLALTHISPSNHRRKVLSLNYIQHKSNFSCKGIGFNEKSRLSISCAMNMTAGQSGDPEKLNFEHLMNKARKLWDSSPQPVKSFPWNRAMENFIQLVLDLAVAVIKYLCLPVLTVTSLSEMSYSAHHKKLFFVPFPLLIGVVLAGVLQETILELSPLLKDAEVPWHLISIAVFFTLIKLPGPYYPFWGRIFIPHLANGVLWRTAWSTILWSRRPRKASEESSLNEDA